MKNYKVDIKSPNRTIFWKRQLKTPVKLTIVENELHYIKTLLRANDIDDFEIHEINIDLKFNIPESIGEEILIK